MKFLAISDTHGQHQNLNLEAADCLIHAGDVSKKGDGHEVEDFLDWFESLDYQYKIFIAGNHDWYFEKQSAAVIKKRIPENVIYLNDSGVEIEGLSIYGSPVQPFFFNWAFNRQRGEDIAQHWKLIPPNTDILITHGPPYGILDETFRKEKVGCEELIKKVEEIQPKVHIFGHIHEAYGQVQKGETLFVNASVVNLAYQLVNEPIAFSIRK